VKKLIDDKAKGQKRPGAGRPSLPRKQCYRLGCCPAGEPGAKEAEENAALALTSIRSAAIYRGPPPLGVANPLPHGWRHR